MIGARSRTAARNTRAGSVVFQKLLLHIQHKFPISEDRWPVDAIFTRSIKILAPLKKNKRKKERKERREGRREYKGAYIEGEGEEEAGTKSRGYRPPAGPVIVST